MAQLHDARFEEINKEPKILSTIKKVKQIDFDKYGSQERHECLINTSGDLSMQKYQVNDSVISKRTGIGAPDISKTKAWDELALDLK